MKLIITFTILLSLSSFTFAQTGNVGRPPSHGTKAGGQTIDVKGSPALRDLQNKSVCVWRYLEDFVKQVAYFPTVLENLDKAHWYLRRQVDQEIPNIRVCLTQGNLVQIPAEDRDKVTTYDLKTKKQVAIRLNQDIFLDINEFSKMPPIDQGYLILHEIVHSFIPIKTERRNHKVESFISALRQYQADPMSQRDFNLQITQNSIITAIDAQRTDFVMMLDETADLNARLDAAVRFNEQKEITKLDSILALKKISEIEQKISSQNYLKKEQARQQARHLVLEAEKKALERMLPFKKAILRNDLPAANAFVTQNSGSVSAQDILHTQLWIHKDFAKGNLLRNDKGVFYYTFSHSYIKTVKKDEDDIDYREDTVYAKNFFRVFYKSPTQNEVTYTNPLEYAVFTNNIPLLKIILKIKGLSPFITGADNSIQRIIHIYSIEELNGRSQVLDSYDETSLIKQISYGYGGAYVKIRDLLQKYVNDENIRN